MNEEDATRGYASFGLGCTTDYLSLNPMSFAHCGIHFDRDTSNTQSRGRLFINKTWPFHIHVTWNSNNGRSISQNGKPMRNALMVIFTPIFDMRHGVPPYGRNSMSQVATLALIALLP